MTGQSTKQCPHQALLWVHRGKMSSHSWSDQQEGTCICKPILMCPVCDNALLHDHGFVLLDEVAFPAHDGTLLN